MPRGPRRYYENEENGREYHKALIAISRMLYPLWLHHRIPNQWNRARLASSGINAAPAIANAVKRFGRDTKRFFWPRKLDNEKARHKEITYGTEGTMPTREERRANIKRQLAGESAKLIGYTGRSRSSSAYAGSSRKYDSSSLSQAARSVRVGGKRKKARVGNRKHTKRARSASKSAAKAVATRAAVSVISRLIQPVRKIQFTQIAGHALPAAATGNMKQHLCLDYGAVQVTVTETNGFANVRSQAGMKNYIECSYPGTAVKGSAVATDDIFTFRNMSDSYEVNFHSNVPVHYEVYEAICISNTTVGFVEEVVFDNGAQYIGDTQAQLWKKTVIADAVSAYGFAEEDNTFMIHASARSREWKKRHVKSGTWTGDPIKFTLRRKSYKFRTDGSSTFNKGDRFTFMKVWTDVFAAGAEPAASGYAAAGRVPNIHFIVESCSRFDWTPTSTPMKQKVVNNNWDVHSSVASLKNFTDLAAGTPAE